MCKEERREKSTSATKQANSHFGEAESVDRVGVCFESLRIKRVERMTFFATHIQNMTSN
jgi:hypothetical protein